ncbi:MAG: C1 family peptidase [Bacteroidales bacterium]|nr:C1 family peptidase [Bacteroidales bacterium]
MYRYILTAAALIGSICLSNAQPQRPGAPEPEYKFTTVKENPITPVKNQYRSGTCWCFSTIGFLESEAIRIKGIKNEEDYPDFSEMFVISHSYKDRAEKYVRVDGALGFSAGSECGDALHVTEDYGLVPQEAMPGIQPLPIHGELDATTRAFVEAVVKNPNKTLSTTWKPAFGAMVDAYLGEIPESFEYKGKTYTPASFRDEMGIVPSDYVSLMSVTNVPFYTAAPLEVADNWRWDTAWNVPIDELMQAIYDAIDKGFTVCWGTDVSEKGFTRNGIGVLLDDQAATSGSDQERWVGKEGEKKEAASVELPKEKPVTQESRQEGYDNKATTDDHGMLIYGVATDQNGTKYFMVKNSWGITGKYNGLWYCSDSFTRAKTMEITIHKDALSKDLKKKLGIK